MVKNYAICYMVAGMSSRFGGKIKQFARIGPNNETLIEVSILQALKAGFNEIVFIVGHMTKVPFYEMFGDEYRGIKVKYVEQMFDSSERDKPWGTNDAVCNLRGVVNCPFVVCNGDDIYGEGAFRAIVEHFRRENNENVTLGYRLDETLPEEGSVNRGIYTLDSKGYVQNLDEVLGIEKKKLSEKKLKNSDLVSLNIFGFYPNVLGMLYENLVRFKVKNKGDRKIECYLPIEVSNLVNEGRIRLKCYECNEKWFGVTNPEDEEKVREELKAMNS